VNLALEELFVNTLRHGGCEGMETAAQIRLQLDEDSVLVEFSDRGRPFDPTAVPPPNLAAPPEERQKGGLGIHFVRYCMRDLTYHREGEWNRLSMRRPLRKEEP
jgi:serine/threonine-protein kinase RsbW